MTPEQAEEKEKLAELISSTRIMTDDDFKVISARQVAKELGSSKSAVRKAKKRKQQEAFGAENRSVVWLLGSDKMCDGWDVTSCVAVGI